MGLELEKNKPDLVLNLDLSCCKHDLTCVGHRMVYWVTQWFEFKVMITRGPSKMKNNIECFSRGIDEYACYKNVWIVFRRDW